MATKKILCQVGMLYMCLLSILPVKAQPVNPFGQTLQINTTLHALSGHPVWFIELRNEESGEILPYQYEIKDFDNFWLALSYGRSYRIVASVLQFEGHNTIHNFCHIEDGILDGKSYIITLTGNLIPYHNNYNCHATKYKNYSFPVALATQ
jgi:hypothetical protein